MTEATAVLEAPLEQSERDQLIKLLDEFLSTGQERSIVPITEVQDLALDIRLILSPAAKQEPA